VLEVYTLIDTSVILSLGDAILGTVPDIYILYFKPHKPPHTQTRFCSMQPSHVEHGLWPGSEVAQIRFWTLTLL